MIIFCNFTFCYRVDLPKVKQNLTSNAKNCVRCASTVFHVRAAYGIQSKGRGRSGCKSDKKENDKSRSYD